MMRVYHFTSAQHALSNLVFQRIKIAQFSDLNDPFELLAPKMRGIEQRSLAEKNKQKMHETHGVICFSKVWNDPVLWAHYADRHKGVCLGFEVPVDFARPVNYIKERMKVPGTGKLLSADDLEEFKDEILISKYAGWDYEKEYRHIAKLGAKHKESGLYFQKFSDELVLKNVYIGLCCDFSVSEINSLISQKNIFPQDVHVNKCKLAVTKFSFVEDVDATRSTKTKRDAKK